MKNTSESKAEQADRILFNTLMIKARQEIFRDKLNEPTDIITRMEAAQQRFGRLQLCDTPPESPTPYDNAQYVRSRRSTSEEIRLRVAKERPETHRKILRCAPVFDAQAEHEADLRYESRVDYENWQTDQESE